MTINWSMSSNWHQRVLINVDLNHCIHSFWMWKKYLLTMDVVEGLSSFPSVDVDYEETLCMTILLQGNWSIELSS